MSDLRNRPDLRASLDGAGWDELEIAFLDAARAFAQYAEARDDVTDESVEGFAIGFLQGAAVKVAE